MCSLKSLWSALIIAALALSVAACSDDDTNKDSGVSDGPNIKKDGIVPPPTKLTCNGDCKDLVMDSLTFPDTTTAATVGVDYTGDGTVDNALGSILGALSGITSSLDLQKSIDNALHQGTTIMLLRMQAANFATAATAASQAWVGQKMACCTSITDEDKCKTEAMAGCYGGSHTFFTDNTASDPKAIFGGSITGGKFQFGSMSSTMSLNLPITGAGALELSLKGVHLMGDVNAAGTKITNGILAGVVTKEDLDTKLLPQIATMLNNTLNDATVDKTTKDTIKTLFDTDADGQIAEAEVKDNALIKTFLAGDVDVDGDGKMELSLGISFTATSATIDESGTAPDAGGPTPDAGGPTPDAGADMAAIDAATGG
jgi:hypothetical protein